MEGRGPPRCPARTTPRSGFRVSLSARTPP